jgi:DNA-directed RNA polymerase subunit RPC12/RpoP
MSWRNSRVSTPCRAVIIPLRATNEDKSLQRNLGMKCSSCGHWSRVPVNKIFIEQPSPELKVKVYIPMYNPLETVKCKKCGKKIAEANELIRIQGR